LIVDNNINSQLVTFSQLITEHYDTTNTMKLYEHSITPSAMLLLLSALLPQQAAAFSAIDRFLDNLFCFVNSAPCLYGIFGLYMSTTQSGGNCEEACVFVPFFMGPEWECGPCDATGESTDGEVYLPDGPLENAEEPTEEPVVDEPVPREDNGAVNPTSSPTNTPTNALGPSTPLQGTDDWTLVWSDEFDGPEIDRNTWTYNTGFGWGNNELQTYTDFANNARIENGELVIEAHEETLGESQYSSARIMTYGAESFTFGRMEARIKLPAGKGMFPAFWMLGGDFEMVDWPACGGTCSSCGCSMLVVPS